MAPKYHSLWVLCSQLYPVKTCLARFVRSPINILPLEFTRVFIVLLLFLQRFRESSEVLSGLLKKSRIAIYVCVS